MARKWKRLPGDGTNYRYWQSDDGFLIETKPRFRPVMPYTLNVPATARKPGSYGEVLFQTLALAKAAADWPEARLVEAMALRDAELARLFGRSSGTVQEKAA